LKVSLNLIDLSSAGSGFQTAGDGTLKENARCACSPIKCF